MLAHSLQRRIVIVFVGLLTLVMALILVLVTRSNEQIVAAEMSRELAAGSHVFTRLIEHNQRQLETAATVLSADFAFREAIATQDRPTIQSVISNHGLRIGAQVMMVVSTDGQLVADTQRKSTEPRPFPFPDLLAEAEASGKSSGIRTMKDGKVYQVVLVPILAPRLIAWVAMGFLVDDRWAGDLAAMTNLSVSIIWRNGTRTAVLASSLTAPQRAALATALTGAPEDDMHMLTIDDEHYRTIALSLGQEASAVLQRSVKEVSAPYRSLQNTLLVIMLSGLALFVIGSVMLARRIVRPIDQLAAAANRIEAGDYAMPVPSLPPDEIGRLAVNFDHMRERVASREQQILKLAFEDPLTGLPNRTRLITTFDQQGEGKHGAVAVLNLDRFTLINNALSHSVGDRLLSEIGSRLGQLLSETDLVARLWADEFAFLLLGADQAEAVKFAEAVLEKLRDTITLDGQRIDVGGSLGIALYPADGQDAATLLRRAEVALSEAKRLHKSFVFADGIGEEPLHEKLSLIGEMRDALARQEFRVYYQPKLNLRSGKIDAAEALIRWQHPERGLIPPFRFIPFAEQTGFISEITPWLLENVAAQTAQWRKEGLFITPSSNLSALDLLNSGLVEHVRQLIESHQIPPHEFCLEITESALMDDPALALKHLEELAALGIKLSIDDYGVGQASLAYLKTLPVHELKIDQTFITSVADSPKNAAIARSTIVLCHALGLSVVAEGVETASDLDWLHENGCDTAQGYYLAKPMPAQELAGWVAAYHAASMAPP
ncbi:MAG: EAL domain-containing protein [Sulfuricellaceae bacterium]|nr:EAL domain-containing protein [Sulfuricellaceae bacterium]